ERRPHHVKRAAQMDVQHRIEVLVRHLLQGRGPDDPGVVDQDVDAAVVIERRLDDRAAPNRRGDRRGTGSGVAPPGPASTPPPFRLPPVSLTTTLAPRDARSRA